RHEVHRELVADRCFVRPDRQYPDAGRRIERQAPGRHGAGSGRGRAGIDRPVAVAVGDRVVGDRAAAGNIQRDRYLGAGDRLAGDDRRRIVGDRRRGDGRRTGRRRRRAATATTATTTPAAGDREQREPGEGGFGRE